MVTWGYRRLQGVRWGYKGLHSVTGDYKGVTRGYMGLQEVTSG